MLLFVAGRGGLARTKSSSVMALPPFNSAVGRVPPGPRPRACGMSDGGRRRGVPGHGQLGLGQSAHGQPAGPPLAALPRRHCRLCRRRHPFAEIALSRKEGREFHGRRRQSRSCNVRVTAPAARLLPATRTLPFLFHSLFEWKLSECKRES